MTTATLPKPDTRPFFERLENPVQLLDYREALVQFRELVFAISKDEGHPCDAESVDLMLSSLGLERLDLMRAVLKANEHKWLVAQHSGFDKAAAESRHAGLTTERDRLAAELEAAQTQVDGLWSQIRTHMLDCDKSRFFARDFPLLWGDLDQIVAKHDAQAEATTKHEEN